MAKKKSVKRSAGILLYRRVNGHLQFFLVHPGGPFWAKKEEGAWSIPKGEPGDDEDLLLTAIREFEEETGTRLTGNFIALAPIKQKAGKEVFAWAVDGDIDENTIRCNTFEIEWPPRSGNIQTYPEIDKSGWFDSKAAKEKINPAQVAFIEELLNKTSS